jgi:hypothetical protein
MNDVGYGNDLKETVQQRRPTFKRSSSDMDHGNEISFQEEQ